MAVRNFWIAADIDGRATELAGGPKSKDGGLSVIIKQRSNGGIVTAYRICCYAVDGELRTEVINSDGELVGFFATDR